MHSLDFTHCAPVHSISFTYKVRKNYASSFAHRKLLVSFVRLLKPIKKNRLIVCSSLGQLNVSEWYFSILRVKSVDKEGICCIKFVSSDSGGLNNA